MQVFAPLRYPLFRRMWLTSVVFNVGHTMHVVAGNWLMLELTGSPLWVGLMVAAPNLPLLVLALPSGAMADMVDRRVVLVLSGVLMMISAVSMSAMWILGMLTAPWLLGLGILVGIGIAFYVPAWQAVVPNLVPREMVPDAISLNSAGGAVSMAAGPALGGALVGFFGPGVPFTAAAVGYLILVASISTIRNVRWRDEVGASMRIAMAIGLRYLRFSTGYRWLLTLTAAFGISSAALRGMLPNVTSERLVSGAGAYGFLLGAMGIGALIGALFREQAAKALGRHLVAWAILAYGVAGLAVGTTRLLMTATIAMVLAGIAWTFVLTTLNSTVQLLAPAWVRARALSVYLMALFGLVPVGTIIAGLLGDAFDASLALVICSVGVVVLAVVTLTKPLPDPSEMPQPDPVGAVAPEDHPTIRSSERVAVITTWEVDPDRLDEFVDVMDEIRRVRLSTGAFRWTLYRDVIQSNRFTELFEVYTWEQHLRQHERLDGAAVRLIQRSIDFDVAGGPRSVHMVAADRATLHDPQWSSAELVQHDELHRTDGSIPVIEDATLPPDAAPAEHPVSAADDSPDEVPRG